MKSKGYITYLNRISQFNADLELIDVLEKAIINNELSKEHLLFKYTDENRHPVLSKRKVTAHSRKMAVNHLRQTVYSSYIKDLYEELYAYLRLLIAESYISAKSTPERIVGEHKISLIRGNPLFEETPRSPANGASRLIFSNNNRTLCILELCVAQKIQEVLV